MLDASEGLIGGKDIDITGAPINDVMHITAIATDKASTYVKHTYTQLRSYLNIGWSWIR